MFVLFPTFHYFSIVEVISNQSPLISPHTLLYKALFGGLFLYPIPIHQIELVLSSLSMIKKYDCGFNINLC